MAKTTAPASSLTADSTTADRSRVGIRYMGNKDGLATRIVGLAANTPQGAPLIDVFAGMCSVAGATATSGRAAWSNDVQRFAALVASCLLKAESGPPSPQRIEKLLIEPYRANVSALSARFAEDLAVERSVLDRGGPARYMAAAADWRHAGNDSVVAREVELLSAAPTTAPYRLTTLTFAWGYFGLAQSIDLDSLRFALDARVASGLLAPEEAAWCRLALLATASRIASAPGHFAQYLRGETETSLRRIRAQRRRSTHAWFLHGLARLEPFGTAEWRSGNEVFCTDALEIWSLLDAADVGSAVVYADPPYSKEHYSRYYHVLETLERYDYPPALRLGRYRPDRFQTPFSRKTEVVAATHRLCEEVASRSWTLILSYPSSGLLTHGLGIDISEILSDHFQSVRLAFTAPTAHSTLGGRHGAPRKDVNEYVWIAR